MNKNRKPSQNRHEPGTKHFWKTKRWGLYSTALIMGIPALTGIVLFYYIPVILAVRYSFYDYNLMARTMSFVAFKNYANLLNDQLFFTSIRITLLFLILKVPLQMVSGLALALLVRRSSKGTGILRTIILLPTVTSMVVVTTVWGFMYHPGIGLFNSILNTVGLPSQGFLTSATQALPSIVILTIWKDVGLTMLFYLAGLLGIPEEYYDAARIDGANSWQQLKYITLPALRDTTLFILIFSTVAAFRVFEPVYLTTQGGPLNATKVLLVLIYDYAFRFYQMGYSSAMTVIFALVLIVVGAFQFIFAREKKPKLPTRRTAYKSNRVPYI
jgi:ABC-type sugar transport system permease subunit